MATEIMLMPSPAEYAGRALEIMLMQSLYLTVDKALVPTHVGAMHSCH